VTALRHDGKATAGPFLVEGSRKLEEWTRLTSRLPDLDSRVEIDAVILSRRLDSLPDAANGLLRLVDGRRTLRAVIEEWGGKEIEAAALLVSLHEDGVLRALPAQDPPATRGTPGPEGVEWFADPAEARRAALAVGTAIPAPERVRGPDPVRASQAPAWVVGAVLALAAAVLLGPEWARRQTSTAADPGPPAALPGGVQATATPSPPALAITEPAPAETARPPAAEPQPPEPQPPEGRPVPPRLAPAYAEAMAAGEASYLAGDFPAAVASFERAVGIRETSDAQAALGRALSDAGRPGEALAALRRATVLDASNGAAWLALGEVQLTGGDPGGARASYERYLAVEPAGRHAEEVRAVLARLRP
jgi:tetratricopeptide (TPR) repeat protein